MVFLSFLSLRKKKIHFCVHFQSILCTDFMLPYMAVVQQAWSQNCSEKDGQSETEDWDEDDDEMRQKLVAMSFPEHKPRECILSNETLMYTSKTISHTFFHFISFFSRFDGIIKCSACGGVAFQNAKMTEKEKKCTAFVDWFQVGLEWIKKERMKGNNTKSNCGMTKTMATMHCNAHQTNRNIEQTNWSSTQCTYWGLSGSMTDLRCSVVGITIDSSPSANWWSMDHITYAFLYALRLYGCAKCHANETTNYWERKSV